MSILQNQMDSLSEHESQNPNEDDNPDPHTPANNTVAVSMSGLAKNTPEDEFPSNVGVDGANDDCGYEDESESGLPCPRLQ